MTGTPKHAGADSGTPLSADEELDNKVISALLDTPAEPEAEGTHNALTHGSQVRITLIVAICLIEILTQDYHQANYVTRSHTLDVLHKNDNCSSSRSFSRAQSFAFPHDLSNSSGPAERNHLVNLTDQSGSGFFQPLARSQTASSPLGGRSARRVLQSSSSSALTSTTRYKGGSPIRKAVSSADKVSHSVTSVLGSSAQVLGKSATGAEDPGGRSKLTRSKTKNVFAKFAGVISDHFGTKGSRREDKSHDATNGSTSMGDTKPAQIIDGLPLPRLALAPLPLTNRGISGNRHSSVSENMNVEMAKAARMAGRPYRPGRTPTMSRKRLTIVDEVTFQEGSPPDDPFSDSASSPPSVENDMESKDDHGKILDLADPFQAERLLDTNTDAILDTPPVGFSTPRRRSRSSWVRCATPTRGPKAFSSADCSDLIDLSDGTSSSKEDRQRKIPIILGSPVKGPVKAEAASQDSAHQDGRNLYDRGHELPDSTRLSSYPPGSTIRPVPRSMGRLTDVPVLSAPSFQQSGPFPVTRKKHPSPSKVQLEMYGQYMESNLAIGVFQDPDELGMSFEAPQASPEMLSPRDVNRLMCGSGATVSNIDLRKDFVGHGNGSGSSNTRSRIPQPVKKVSRSRTETALAKDFYAANAGDMSTEDELQWDSSEYQIGHRCTHCGSMNKL